MAYAMINRRMGVTKIYFGNMTMELNIFDISKQPLEYDEVRNVCLIEEIIEDIVNESSIEDPLEACFAQFGCDFDLDKLLEQADAILESALVVSSENGEIAILELPKKELKPLPETFKYKFLSLANSLHVIISSNLVDAHEEKFYECQILYI